RLTGWTLKGAKKDNSTPAFIDTTYRYDELGNIERVEANGAVSFAGSYGIAGGKPHTLASSTVSASYTYDAAGRQLTGNGRAVEWSQFDLPRTITTPMLTREFLYDGDGKRVTRE